MSPYGMVRQPDSDSAAVRLSGWARWEILDPSGGLVGFVAEEREWLGHTWSPSTYTAVHDPTGADFGALWRTEGHPTPKAAFGALTAHLAGVTDPSTEGGTR